MNVRASPRLRRFGSTRSRAVRLRPQAWFVLPAALFILVFSVVPLVELARMAVSDVGFGNIVSGSWPFTAGENAQDLVSSRAFGEAMFNTLVFVAVVLVVSVGGGLAIAVLIRPKTGPRRITQAVLVFVWALPPVVLGSAWKFLLFSDGVANEYLSFFGVDTQIFWIANPDLALFTVATVNAWAAVPFAALVLKAGLVSLPSEPEEAAAVDGATTWQTFRHVTVPQLRPVVAVLSILIIVYAFRSFDFIFVMTQGGPGTASSTLPYLSYVLSFRLGFFGRGAAAALIAGVFVAVFAVVYVRLTRHEAVAE